MAFRSSHLPQLSICHRENHPLEGTQDWIWAWGINVSSDIDLVFLRGAHHSPTCSWWFHWTTEHTLPLSMRTSIKTGKWEKMSDYFFIDHAKTAYRMELPSNAQGFVLGVFCWSCIPVIGSTRLRWPFPVREKNQARKQDSTLAGLPISFHLFRHRF